MSRWCYHECDSCDRVCLEHEHIGIDAQAVSMINCSTHRYAQCHIMMDLFDCASQDSKMFRITGLVVLRKCHRLSCLWLNLVSKLSICSCTGILTKCLHSARTNAVMSGSDAWMQLQRPSPEKGAQMKMFEHEQRRHFLTQLLATPSALYVHAAAFGISPAAFRLKCWKVHIICRSVLGSLVW